MIYTYIHTYALKNKHINTHTYMHTYRERERENAKVHYWWDPGLVVLSMVWVVGSLDAHTMLMNIVML